MKLCFSRLLCRVWWLIFLSGFDHPVAGAAGVNPYALSPVGETKPFHGTLRAVDLRHGTLSLGSSTRISRVLALDAQSRLVKGLRPASLAEFAIGDVLEGFAFPDQYGRMVVAVVTARARPLTAAESRSGRASKPRKSRVAEDSKHRAVVKPNPANPAEPASPGRPPASSSPRARMPSGASGGAPAPRRGLPGNTVPVPRTPKK